MLVALARQNKLIRSLHISADLLQSRAGGLGRYVDGLTRNLLPSGSASVIGIGKSKHQAAASASDSLPRRLLSVRRKVRDLLPNVDLIASHFALYASGSTDLLQTRPHVVHFHGPWAEESRREGSGAVSTALKKFVESRVYHRAQRAIALSKSFARILVERYRVPEEIVRVIPGGIDPPTSPMIERVAARIELGWPTDRPIVLCVRRLARRMGLDTLIDAVGAVRAKHPDVLTLIAGKGSIQADLQTRIVSAGLGDHVKLLGFVPDELLTQAYAAADLSIVPTQALEGFGLITLESLVQGTPVLVTPVGGLPEVVSELNPALILEGAAVNSIAAGIVQALSQPHSLPTREACRAYAVSRFAWPTIADRVLSVYGEACSSFKGYRSNHAESV